MEVQLVYRETVKCSLCKGEKEMSDLGFIFIGLPIGILLWLMVVVAIVGLIDAIRETFYK